MILLKDTEASWHLSKLAKESSSTYVYVSCLMPKLEQKGYVRMEKKGRTRLVKLTDKGLAVAGAIQEAMNRLQA